MSERTALEIAIDLDSASCSSFVKLEAAEALRRQHAEIDRLKRERHHIYDLLARTHRDGGQYTAEHGVEKACDDAEAQVVAWLDTVKWNPECKTMSVARSVGCCKSVAFDRLCRMEDDGMVTRYKENNVSYWSVA